MRLEPPQRGIGDDHFTGVIYVQRSGSLQPWTGHQVLCKLDKVNFFGSGNKNVAILSGAIGWW